MAHLAGERVRVARPTAGSTGSGCPTRPTPHGWSMSSADVGRFTVADPGHFAELPRRRSTTAPSRCVEHLDADGYARVVDANGGTRRSRSAIRIVSVLDDAVKHLGQAEYVRGLVERRR